MNQNLQSSAPSGRGLCPEDVVIIVVVGIGFVGSVIIYGLDLPPIMVAIFLATGVASLVYRFLGGIQSATFNIGPVKLAGTIAALISCAWFINVQLKDWYLDKHFDPKVNEWFAISKDYGFPVEVEIKGVKGSIEKPLDVFDNIELHMKHDDHKFMVISEEDSTFKLGSVSDQVLCDINLFNTIECSDTSDVTRRLPAETTHVRLRRIPFKLSTGTYGGNISEYFLTDSAGDTLHGGSISLREAQIVKLGDEYYLVGVVEVDHTLDDSSYAKFVVRKIVPQIKP